MKNILKLLQGVEVEWKPLGEVTHILRGKRLTRNLLSASDKYPVFHGGLEPLGYYNNMNRAADTVMVINVGASAGTVGYSSIDFWSSDGTYCIERVAELNNKFLYYYLLGEQHFLKSRVRVAGIPTLDAFVIEKLQIPIPPLEIQNEIVRILDKFSTLTAELQAELQARKSQYKYYRNELLDYPMEESDQPSLRSSGSAPSIKESDNPTQPQSAPNPPTNNSVLPPRGKVEWKRLGEVGELIRGNGLQKKDFTETGVGCIHYGQIYTYYGTYTYTTKSFVSEELADKLQKVDQGDVVITNTSENTEDVGKAVAYLGKKQIVTGGHATIFKPSNKIIGKYLVYFTQTEIFASQKRKLAKGTKVIDVSAADMAKILIPIPPLSEQARIVSILDKFDTLTNSISEGLPKEIELRQKQYEYYRDKLLTFPSLRATPSPSLQAVPATSLRAAGEAIQKQTQNE